VLIEQLHQEAILLFFLFVLVLPFLYQVLWLGDEENGGGDIDGQLAPHLARPPVHCRLLLTLRETAPEDRVAVGNNRWYKLREDPCSVSWTNLKSLLLMRCTKCSFRPHVHQFEVLHGKGLEAGE